MARSVPAKDHGQGRVSRVRVNAESQQAIPLYPWYTSRAVVGAKLLGGVAAASQVNPPAMNVQPYALSLRLSALHERLALIRNPPQP